MGAPQLSRLLQHLVENALTGELREVKEYSLGVELFDRGASFDPRLDNIVRAHARRLRQRLEAYFDGPGRVDPVIIEIPKGHYLAVFRANHEIRASHEKVVASLAELTGGPHVDAMSDSKIRPQQHPRKNSICVLPFVNMSGDAEQEYFSDGISEDIITDLSKVSALFVIARNTAFTFKAKSVDVPQVARQLNVSHVLEGSVRKAGGRVRITAQLIDGATGGHVWAERYDRDLTDIFALQDEIAEAIVSALKLKLLPQEKQQIERRGTSNLEAYDLYLRGTRPAFRRRRMACSHRTARSGDTAGAGLCRCVGRTGESTRNLALPDRARMPSATKSPKPSRSRPNGHWRWIRTTSPRWARSSMLLPPFGISPTPRR